MVAPSISSDHASTWLRPDQVERIRTVCYDDRFQSTLWQRNEAVIAVLYDTGLRASELVQLDVDHLHRDTGTIRLPAAVQSRTRTTAPPSPDSIELDREHTFGTARLLTSYLYNRENDSRILFPSRNGGRLTPKAVRDVVTNVAKVAEIRPYTPTGRGEPADVSPQTLRHSTAWRLLNIEDQSLTEVRDRLRHTALSTTRSLYAEFDVDGGQTRSSTYALDDPSSRSLADDVLDVIPDILYAFDTSGQIVWWNDRVTAVTGYTDAKIADMHPLEFVAEKDTEKIADAIAHVIDEKVIEPRDAHLVTKDDDYLPYEFTGAPLTDGEGTVWGVAGVGRDITARKRFERISDGFYAVDTDWRFTYLNSRAETLLGRSMEDLLGVVVWDEFPQATSMQVYDEFQTAMETQEPVSFDQHYPPWDTWFDIRAYPSETGLSVYFRNITDRKERERELEHQRTALAQLDQFNTLVQNLVHAVVDESTRTEIEQTVCDRLAASDFYQAAWIGDMTGRDTAGSPRVWAGISSDAVSNIAAASKIDPSPGIAERAAEAREVCVAQAGGDDPTVNACREHLQAVDIEAALAVPIRYGDAVYGVLVVYAIHPTTFDDRQQASFGDLGETIGFAITAAERKDALAADSVLDLTLDIWDPDQFFIRAAIEFGTAVRLEGIAGQGDDAYLEYFTVRDASPEEIHDLAEGIAGIDHLRVVSTQDTECLCEVGLTGASIVSAVAERGGTVTQMIAEGDRGTVRIDLSRTADIGPVIDALEATVADVELQAKRTVDRPVQTEHRFQAAVTDRLTDKQQDTLETAFLAGFFEQPRHSTGKAIAESMDISPSTFHQHLRIGLRKLVSPIVKTPKEEA